MLNLRLHNVGVITNINIANECINTLSYECLESFSLFAKHLSSQLSLCGNTDLKADVGICW